MKITIGKFKKIDSTETQLKPINILIGSNNAGKSSFIQGIQFAISACQTLELEKAPWKGKNSRTLSLDSTEFLYTPTKDIGALYHGKRLTGSRKRIDRAEMRFEFNDGKNQSIITISKGKNGGYTTTLIGKTIGLQLCDISQPYCVYVPGIAGIPPQEKFEVAIAVKKSAIRGDSNHYLRNIIYSISKEPKKWDQFIHSINSIYPNIDIKTIFDENKSEYIIVNVITNQNEIPLDAIGTGLLQTIQIFAYIEYFNPKIILLDEPDAHIHPTKQKQLAKALADRISIDKSLKIVFSTHSRYILEALEKDANVCHLQDGKTYQNVKNSSILIDIGAADTSYLFSKKKIKYIIATEDKIDNIDEKKNFIRTFLLANNVKEDEFILHSYEGCTKVHFAKILESFVAKHIPGAKVLLHIDRDQKIDTDQDIIKLKEDCDREGITLFITKYQEIESYFCTPDHIHKSSGVPLTQAKLIYEKMIEELEEETKRKLTNFILRERPHLGFNKSNRSDIKIINSKVNNWYENYRYELTPGKELLGKIKEELQSLGKNPNCILSGSAGLICEDFKKIFANPS